MPHKWEVQGKCGNGWTNLGIYTALSDLSACRAARLNRRYRIMRVRSAEITDKWMKWVFSSKKSVSP
jgi:hypothetical protein